jgi:uncharacterized membrane protein YkoI
MTMRLLRLSVAAVFGTTACSNEAVTNATAGDSPATSSAASGAAASVPLEEDRPALQSEAAISDAAARAIALRQIPGGQIVEGELEDDGGKLVYEYEVRTADGRRIVEVEIDARTGAVARVDSEAEDGEEAEDRDGPSDDPRL